jgi:hypothetical protein
VSEFLVVLETKVFDELARAKGFKTQAEIAKALKCSDSQLGKVRAHTSQPGPLFIHHTLTVFGVPYATVFSLKKKDEVA